MVLPPKKKTERAHYLNASKVKNPTTTTAAPQNRRYRFLRSLSASIFSALRMTATLAWTADERLKVFFAERRHAIPL